MAEELKKKSKDKILEKVKRDTKIKKPQLEAANQLLVKEANQQQLILQIQVLSKANQKIKNRRKNERMKNRCFFMVSTD